MAEGGNHEQHCCREKKTSARHYKSDTNCAPTRATSHGAIKQRVIDGGRVNRRLHAWFAPFGAGGDDRGGGAGRVVLTLAEGPRRGRRGSKSWRAAVGRVLGAWHVSARDDSPVACQLRCNDGFVVRIYRRPSQWRCVFTIRRRRVLSRHCRAGPRTKKRVIDLVKTRCPLRWWPARKAGHSWIGRVVNVVVKRTEVRL